MNSKELLKILTLPVYVGKVAVDAIDRKIKKERINYRNRKYGVDDYY